MNVNCDYNLLTCCVLKLCMCSSVCARVFAIGSYVYVCSLLLQVFSMLNVISSLLSCQMCLVGAVRVTKDTCRGFRWRCDVAKSFTVITSVTGSYAQMCCHFTTNRERRCGVSSHQTALWNVVQAYSLIHRYQTENIGHGITGRDYSASISRAVFQYMKASFLVSVGK